MDKTTQLLPVFDCLVVRPIDNGFLLEIEAENGDKKLAYTSLRQVINQLKKLDAARAAQIKELLK